MCSVYCFTAADSAFPILMVSSFSLIPLSLKLFIDELSKFNRAVIAFLAGKIKSLGTNRSPRAAEVAKSLKTESWCFLGLTQSAM